MNHYKAEIFFSTDYGQDKTLSIKFGESSNSSIEQIEQLAISIGYRQLISEGYNLAPESEDYFFFRKIKSLQVS